VARSIKQQVGYYDRRLSTISGLGLRSQHNGRRCAVKVISLKLRTFVLCAVVRSTSSPSVQCNTIKTCTAPYVASESEAC
jgi:hypothetical protein